MQIWPLGLQACISLLSFSRKDRCSKYYVPPRCHELCPTGVCHPLYTRNQRTHAGGDIKRAGQEVSTFYNNLCGKRSWFCFLIPHLHFSCFTRKHFEVKLFRKRKPQEGLMSGSSPSAETPANVCPH